MVEGEAGLGIAPGFGDAARPGAGPGLSPTFRVGRGLWRQRRRGQDRGASPAWPGPGWSRAGAAV